MGIETGEIDEPRGQGAADDAAGRRRRLAVIVVVAAVALGSGLVVSAIGGRRVDREVDRIRKMAATGTTVSPDALVSSAMSGAPDPAAAAFATDADVDAFQLRDNTWCLELTVSRLLSRRTISLALGLDGRLTDVPSCARA